MRYTNVKGAAAKWGLSERRVRELCQEGRVAGVTRSGREWLIPNDAQRPTKGKAKKAGFGEERLELYLNPTYCDNLPSSTVTEEERLLSRVADLFLRGHFEEAKQALNRLREQNASDPYLMVAQMMLYLIYSCSEPNDEKAELEIAEIDEALRLHPGYQYTKDLVGCVLDGKLQFANLANVPNKFMPIFVESACYIGVMDDLSERRKADPATLELLSRVVDEAEQPALALYAHVALVLYHHLRHEPELYNHHVKKTLEIALPRKWYAPLANTAYVLGWQEVEEADPDAYQEIQRISSVVLDNYVRKGRFGNVLPGIDVLGPDEFKVAYMSSKGMSIKDISATLGMSVYKTRKTLKSAYVHTGTTDREELQALLTKQFKAL